MIDYQARANLAQQRQTSALMQGVKEALSQGLQKPDGEASDVLKLVFKKEEDNSLLTAVGKIGQALSLIYTQMRKPIAIPKVLNITGKVEVTKQPPVRVTNMDDLGKYFQSLEQKLTVWAQAASTAQPPRIDFPKFDFPKNDPVDMTGVISAVQSLENALQGREKSSDTALLRRMADSLDAFVNTPRLTPQPVTNVTLNPLNGFVKTTDNTVGTSPVTIPNYGQLLNRRAVQIYNNSSNTIYIGGSDVTTATGFPVPAGAYAPTLDAGYDLPIYAIAGSAGNDVRVIEISKDKTGNIQE